MISNFSLSFSYRTDSSMKNIIYLIYILILCLLLSEKVSLGSQLYAKFIWKTLFNRLWTSWKPATQLIQCQFRMNLDFPVDALCSGFVSMDGSILVPISLDFPKITKTHHVEMHQWSKLFCGKIDFPKDYSIFGKFLRNRCHEEPLQMRTETKTVPV